jgi:NAD(P)-dependent dehydrogenase (short-subunit alcohol dehydrogenase family)
MPDAAWLGLDGRRVLVAGGAGTIGRALVEGYLAAGANVAVIDIGFDGLGELAPRVSTVAADLRDPDACRAAVTSARDALGGGIDVFVHCVGINNRKPIEEYTDQEWEDILEINLSSAFHTAAAVAPIMREQGDGRIVFFSSVAGRSGHKLHGPYAATKGALNQLARVMAHEYAADGVTVNAVAPGYMETALTNAYLEANPAKKEALLGLIPAGRFGQLDEVVGPVLFLSSAHAGFINGQILYIDGGRSVV